MKIRKIKKQRYWPNKPLREIPKLTPRQIQLYTHIATSEAFTLEGAYKAFGIK